MYFEIFVNNKLYDVVYDTQDIIKISCDLVNGCGVDPDRITIIEKEGKQIWQMS